VHAVGHVEGVRLKLQRPSEPGRLMAQIVMRGFGERPLEVADSVRLQITSPVLEITAAFDSPLRLEGAFSHFTAEPWLAWEGDAPLILAQDPEII
jgi:hypothetical protein